MVVVDFVEPSEARAAQKGLAYRSYKHTPLYLEWAPVNAVDRKKVAAAKAPKASAGTAATGSSSGGNTTSAAASSGARSAAAAAKGAGEAEDDQQQYSSLFIKNLNFSTSEVNLKDHLLHLGVDGLRTVLIQKKQVGKNMLSQGYGFAEFRSPECAERALAKLKGKLDCCVGLTQLLLMTRSSF
jgi:multiple RNA-binding domain-containing protein 1